MKTSVLFKLLFRYSPGETVYVFSLVYLGTHEFECVMTMNYECWLSNFNFAFPSNKSWQNPWKKSQSGWLWTGLLKFKL